MSVEINPAQQLGFHRPLTQLVKRTLTVINPNPQPVAFKVKTTAPKQYCVRPNSGRIEPGERVEVQVLLQPMKEDPEPGAKCRDKFLVQSAVITPEREDRPLNELWSMIEKEDKSAISEHKIRCAYLPPVETPAEGDAPHTNGAGTAAAAASALGAAAAGVGAVGVASTLARDDDDDAKYNTVRSHMGSSPLNRAESPATTSAPETTSREATPLADPIPAAAAAATSAAAPLAAAKKEEAAKPTSTTSSATTAASSVHSSGANGILPPAAPAAAAAATLPSVSEEKTHSLEKKLAEAEREITRLKAQLKEAESGLKQRHVANSAALPSPGTLGQQTQQVVKGEAGVPLQTVGMIVAGTFVFTWLFF